MSSAKQIVKKLYTENKYGIKHQDPYVNLTEEEIRILGEHYPIRTDVHQTCVKCQVRQFEKYGENKIKCNFIPKGLPPGSKKKAEEIARKSDISVERATQIMLATHDPVAWAELMFGFDDNDPDWHLRAYQKEQLRCSSMRIAIREGRRSGKSFIIALRLINLMCTLRIKRGSDSQGNILTSGPTIMVVTPYQAQLNSVFSEMEQLLKRNEELSSFITTGSAGNLYVKTPFFKMSMTFADGAVSTISGFVSGLGIKADGSAGGTMRGQSADIVYADEMDMIPSDILEKVITPILLTTPKTMMIATSTPIGEKGHFYKWCVERSDFKEDFYPSTVLPHWEIIEEELLTSTTKSAFDAEYLAIFGDNDKDLFKRRNILKAQKEYDLNQTMDPNYLRKTIGIQDPDNTIKCMGIDWNKNAGSEFFIAGWSPSAGVFYEIESVNISSSSYSSKGWIEEVIRLNFKHNPQYIYADEGYGHTIIEDLVYISRLAAAKTEKTKLEEATAKIVDRIVPFNFSKNVEMREPITGEKFEKLGKHFLVENMVRLLEDGKFIFSKSDTVLANQLSNYQIKKLSSNNNKPIYGMEKESIGDHRLDACMLAIGGLVLEISLYSKQSKVIPQQKLITERPAFGDNQEASAETIFDNFKKASFPGALDILVIEREKRIDAPEDRKRYAKAQESVANTGLGAKRSDIFRREESAPSILSSIKNKVNEFTSGSEKSGPNRTVKSRSWR